MELVNQASQAIKVQTPLLFRLSQAELDQLFDTLAPAAISELNGSFRGRLMGVSGLGLLPRVVRAWVYALLQTPLNPWRGKCFANGEGSNLWLSAKGQLRFAHYVVARDAASGQEYLNYDIASNWKPVRGIRGEARWLNDSVVLARMNYRTADKTVRVLYFTLEAF